MTNRGFGGLGSEKAPPGTRHAIEDRLIQVLDDCLNDPPPGLLCVCIEPFREWLRVNAGKVGWDQTNYFLCMRDDVAAEATVLFTAATLKRMAHTHEWCINKLMERGLPISMIPEGQQYLGA
jgi:hypothetical protein